MIQFPTNISDFTFVDSFINPHLLLRVHHFNVLKLMEKGLIWRVFPLDTIKLHLSTLQTGNVRLKLTTKQCQILFWKVDCVYRVWTICVENQPHRKTRLFLEASLDGSSKNAKISGGHNARDGDVTQERAGRASTERGQKQAEVYYAPCVPSHPGSASVLSPEGTRLHRRICGVILLEELIAD